MAANNERSVSDHYTINGLGDRILAALEAAGICLKYGHTCNGDACLLPL